MARAIAMIATGDVPELQIQTIARNQPCNCSWRSFGKNEGSPVKTSYCQQERFAPCFCHQLPQRSSTFPWCGPDVDDRPTGDQATAEIAIFTYFFLELASPNFITGTSTAPCWSSTRARPLLALFAAKTDACLLPSSCTCLQRHSALHLLTYS